MNSFASRAAGGGIPKPSTLVMIGGGIVKDPDQPDHLKNPGGILDRICTMAGLSSHGKTVVIVNLGFESEEQAQYYSEAYHREFMDRGADNIIAINNLQSLRDNLDALTSPDTTLIHFCGGDQKLAMSILQETKVPEILRERMEAGGVVISGNSAGAHLLSDHMIYEEETGLRGLGLTQLVGDTHVDVESHLREKTGQVRGTSRVREKLEATSATRGMAIPKGVAVAITGNRVQIFGEVGKSVMLVHRPGLDRPLEETAIPVGESSDLPGFSLPPPSTVGASSAAVGPN